MRIMVITHEAYCSAQRFFLSGEPDRGLAASRRPFGAVRFPGSPDRHRAIPSRQRSSSMPSYRKNTTNQPTTKVSTFSQDLTKVREVFAAEPRPRKLQTRQIANAIHAEPIRYLV